MGNCLVTKLKGVVDNPNLPKLGEMTLTATYYSGPDTIDWINRVLELSNTQDCVVSIDGDGYFVLDYADIDNPSAKLTTYTIPANARIGLFFSNGNYKVHISNKYTLTHFSTYDRSYILSIDDISDLTFGTFTDVMHGNNRKTTGDVNIITKINSPYIHMNDCAINGTLTDEFDSSMTHLDLGGNPFSGNVSKFTNLVDSNFLSVANTGVTGDIAALGVMTKLKNCHIFGSGITGTAESLFNAMVANGRTSGTIAKANFGSDITYQKQPAGVMMNIRFGTSMVNPTAEETARGWQVPS